MFPAASSFSVFFLLAFVARRNDFSYCRVTYGRRSRRYFAAKRIIAPCRDESSCTTEVHARDRAQDRSCAIAQEEDLFPSLLSFSFRFFGLEVGDEVLRDRRYRYRSLLLFTVSEWSKKSLSLSLFFSLCLSQIVCKLPCPSS